ncbi:uncharacterized protein LOC122021277 [Zingiber officinale]|uniref:uncharacterized protein LOC122021277 n=1 Tax=Zingiber officinale TaxID=94328 RepID=UPI001C4BC4FD|nr:uncharacterized protein LOC122021277 [Zingiber officinale]
MHQDLLMESMNTLMHTSSTSLLCCMCGDLGISEQLFQCSVCRVRLQHQYCSNLYPKLERYSTCNWCLRKHVNGGSKDGGTRKRGRVAAEDELKPCSRSRQKQSFTSRVRARKFKLLQEVYK